MNWERGFKRITWLVSCLLTLSCLGLTGFFVAEAIRHPTFSPPKAVVFDPRAGFPRELLWWRSPGSLRVLDEAGAPATGPGVPLAYELTTRHGAVRVTFRGDTGQYRWTKEWKEWDEARQEWVESPNQDLVMWSVPLQQWVPLPAVEEVQRVVEEWLDKEEQMAAERHAAYSEPAKWLAGLSVVAFGLPWLVFYVGRWIARGFGGDRRKAHMPRQERRATDQGTKASQPPPYPLPASGQPIRLKNCLRFLFLPGGRSDRRQYAAVSFGSIALFLVILLVGTISAPPEITLTSLFPVLAISVYLFLLAGIRRLHDLDRTGWWMLLYFGGGGAGGFIGGFIEGLEKSVGPGPTYEVAKGVAFLVGVAVSVVVYIYLLLARGKPPGATRWG